MTSVAHLIKKILGSPAEYQYMFGAGHEIVFPQTNLFCRSFELECRHNCEYLTKNIL